MDLENFPTRETARDMMSMISPIYDRSYVGKWIFEVMAFPLGLAQDAVKDLELQAFPETATWSLPWWEDRYGIPINEYLSMEERRKAIVHRRNTKAPMNPFRIREIVKNLTGRDVDLRENVAPHTYEVTIFPGESNVDIDLVYDTIDDIRQPQKHVNIVFEVPVGVRLQIGVEKQVFPYRITGSRKKAGRWPRPSNVGVVSDSTITIAPSGYNEVFPYILAGTRPDISTIGALQPVNIDVETAAAKQPFPFPVAGTRPDVSTIGRPEALELDIDPETGAQAFAYRMTGDEQKTGKHPDVNMIGSISEQKLDIAPGATGQEFTYRITGEDKKAGTYPDVNTTGEDNSPGVNAHITGDTAGIVYKICGAKRL